MDLKLRLILLPLYLIVVLAQEDAQIEDHFRIDCGKDEINPFIFFCHNGVRVPCDASHCLGSRSESSSKRCALFCGQVLQKLQQLPREIAALKIIHNEISSLQQNLTDQYHEVARLQTENSKLLNHTRSQTNTVNKDNNIITSQQERINDLEIKMRNFMICVIIEGVLLLIAIVVLVSLVVKHKLCVKGKPEESDVDEEPLLVKLSGKQSDTKSTTKKESTADSAFESTSSGFTQPTEDQHDQQKHKCDVLNEVKPTDANVKAPVVTTAAKSLADSPKDTVQVAEESS